MSFFLGNQIFMHKNSKTVTSPVQANSIKAIDKTTVPSFYWNKSERFVF